MKGLRVYIYKYRGFDGSNSGLSHVCDKVTIISSADCLIPEVFTVSDDAPAVQLKKHAGIIIAVPVPTRRIGLIGPMHGGSFIHSCDSRLSQYMNGNAIPLHDRWEMPQ